MYCGCPVEALRVIIESTSSYHSGGCVEMNQSRHWILGGLFVVVLALSTGWFLLVPSGQGSETFLGARYPEHTLIIDAGHGGEDGGAVSLSGVAESGINLAIALKLDHLLGLYGVAPILLRSEDISIYDSGAKTLREKKVSDLHNRVDIIEGAENPTLISIHQNTYQSAKYHGAQVFYSNSDLSLPFAVLTQDTLRNAIDPGNGRAPAKIPDTVYLMSHITCRAILVECGFLSNPQEDLLLQTGNYQTKLAAALASSWLRLDTVEPTKENGE